MHLCVFSDGTWNTPDQMDAGLPAPTNVVKLRNALAEKGTDGAEQRVYYHPGVGTDGSWWNRVVGGGLGEGLDRNIMSAYAWLCRNYQREARIWLFGFSRGAYTARSLGGMISRCGLIDPEASELDDAALWSAVKETFGHYRTPADQVPDLVASDELHFHGVATGSSTRHSIRIHFIGVWDTVGALGVPDDMGLLNLIDNPDNFRFHDTDLSPVVQNARHALAIDEMRQSFTPTLWTNVEDDPRVKQVWFPGVHADVGGGYGRCELSDGALGWMMDEAHPLGLGLRPTVRAKLAPPKGQGFLHDSATGIFQSLKTRPRDVPLFDTVSRNLHVSALARHDDPPLSQGPYWKTRLVVAGASESVDIFARPHWNFTGLYLEAGVPYTFSAQGQWLDSSLKSGPAGTQDGQFHLGEIAHVASSLIGKGEALFARLSGNPQVDFWYTKRQEAMPWFALIGLVANGVHVPPAGTKVPDFPTHEVFLIGNAAQFTPSRSGYLYAFANDAWQAYDNNAGSVRLTVSR
ncbi:DUF2235 domain-containing protein [Rhizobium sp. SGZ-381]|uniref:DUF2235 domain-containing protein n=1 Tax=Rhizobium sp. SGZ-381 TaxID=3342800 RepID=UPI003670FBD2